MELTKVLTPEISEALGRSLIYEECRGDFALARQIAEAQLSEARQSNDTAKIIYALIGRGVVDFLQGETLAALDCFEEVEQTDSADANKRLLAFCFSVLAAHQRYLIFPHGGSSSTLEIQLRWDQIATANQNEEKWQQLTALSDDSSVQLIAAFLYKVLHNVPIGRYVLDGTRELGNAEESNRRAQMMVQPLLLFRQQAESASSSADVLAGIDRVIADLCYRIRYTDDAQQYLKQAQETFEQLGDSAGVASCWMLFGDWMCAPISSPLVWNHYMLEGDWSNSLSWVRERAEFDRSALNIEAALQAYSEAQTEFQNAGANRGIGAIELRLGYLRMLADDYDQALAHIENAQRNFEQSGDKLGQWLALTHRIAALIGSDRRVEDREAAKRIGEWGKTESSFSYTTGLGIFLAREGRRWLMREGDYERAMACYRLASLLFQYLGAIDNAAQLLSGEGVAGSLIGDQALARVAYEEARDTFTELIAARPSMARAAWQKAVMTADEVCQVTLAMQDADGIALSAERLREIFDSPQQGGPDLFGEAFQDTLGEQVKLRIEFASVLSPFCKALDELEESSVQNAEALFEQALDAAHRTTEGHRDFLKAIVLRALRRTSEAEEAFDHYLEQGGAAAGFLGDLSSRMAQRFGPAGQEIDRDRPEQTHRLAARFFADVKSYAKARHHIEALSQIAGDKWWSQDNRPWESLRLCGEVCEGEQRFDEALDYYDRAIELLEARRGLLRSDESRLSLAGESGSQYLYLCAARTAIKAHLSSDKAERDQVEHYVDRSFDYAERGKARALLDLMAARRMSASSTSSEMVRDWRQVNAQLALRRGLLARERAQLAPDSKRIDELAQQIDDDEAKALDLESRIAQADPALNLALNNQAQTMSLNEVRLALVPGTALLEYFFLGDDLLAWAITRDLPTLTHHAMIEARALTRQIRAFHRECERREPLQARASEIAQTLLEPLTEIISPSDSLIIIPHGAAHVLPFQALLFEEKPLSENRAISYMPSASALQFFDLKQSSKLANRILAIGNPTKDLPAAATEAAFVASLFQHKPLIGDEASKEEVSRQIAQYPLLHFATHGNLSEDAPLDSSISLASGESLKVHELMGLQLNADLVVLSACDTAQGKTTGGDDVVGLTRGLLAAGARAAVVSLWPVDDVSTSLFMGQFYRRLRAGDILKVAIQNAQNYLRNLRRDEIEEVLDDLNVALQQAGADQVALEPVSASRGQRHLYSTEAKFSASDYSHPFYWAPFILVG